MFGCCEVESDVAKAVKGQHKLLSVITTLDKVVFQWEHDSTKQVLSSILSRDRVRPVYDGKPDSIPTIKFRWKSAATADMATIMQDYIVYMEIHCTESQFPINSNFNKTYTSNSGYGISNDTETDIVNKSTWWDEQTEAKKYDFLMYKLYLSEEESKEYCTYKYSDFKTEFQEKIVSNL
jgi:hypothetical protein